MKIKINKKGFALAEILAVTLVMMVIFTVLYSNFMPLSGEYAKSKNYNDISSQYELHYFRKLFQEYITDETLYQQVSSELETNKYILLIGQDSNSSEKSCDSLTGTNQNICINLKTILNPTLILTNYNISQLKSELRQDTNKLLALRTYILSLPDYNDRDSQQEIYRLIIKTDSGYANVKLKYEKDDIPKIDTKNATEFVQANVGQNGLEQITHTINNTLQVDSRFKTEYRYRGGNVSNYVTFNNEIWRIIGIIPTEDASGNVENRFKIIKDTSIGNKKWNETSSNNWTTSTLNTYLNNEYYNTLSTNAQNMIGTTKYYLGGYNNSNMTSDIMWQYERKNESNKTGYYYGTNPIMQNSANKKIAIMYASDYGYAAPKTCSNNLYDYSSSTNCKTTNNWLDKGTSTWLLSQYSGNSSRVFLASLSSYVGNNDVIYEYAIRPTLTLSSNVKISGGNGTTSNPYQLTL